MACPISVEVVNVDFIHGVLLLKLLIDAIYKRTVKITEKVFT
jgi:hypothetical protein